MDDASTKSRLATPQAALADALQRVAAGDRDALAEVYRRSAAKLFGVCLRILRDRSEAEEVLQEVYISVWRRAGSFEPNKGGAMTWLGAIARNRAIDRLRQRRESAAPIEDAAALPDAAPAAAEMLETDDDYKKLAACLEGLDPRTAAAIRSAFFDGFTYEALARQSDTPLGTMKSRIRRGLLALRDCMDS